MGKKLYWPLAIILSLSSFQSRADSSSEKLKLFLTSCAYGTAGGALVGVASLAFASNPSSSFNNVARGASLGLYAGIGVGLYLINDSTKPQETSSAYVTPEWYQGKIEGAQLNYVAIQF